MRFRPSRLALVALATIAAGLGAALALGTEEAREAARTAGRALTSSRADALKPLLPAKGKVHLTLSTLGPEEGMFAGGQVVAVFRDFLSNGSVSSFEVVRVDSDGRTGALALTRATIVDREGRNAKIGLRLGFAPENGRWVLREVKETAE